MGRRSGSWVPPEFGAFRVENVLVGDARVSVTVSGDDVSVAALPRSVHVMREPRDPDDTDTRDS